MCPAETLTAGPAWSSCCASCRSGMRVASGGADKVVRLWDPVTGHETGQLHGMMETVTEVAFTCDAKYVLASGADQAVRMWDISSGRVRHTLTGHSQKVWCCAFRSGLSGAFACVDAILRCHILARTGKSCAEQLHGACQSARHGL